MKKVLSILLAAGALTAIYFIARKKTSKAEEPIPIKNIQKQREHHLTKAFANAKKHAVK